MFVLIRIDPSSDRAIYAQIADSVRADVASGVIAAGDVLPTARTVAAGLQVNQHTVLHAYQLLRDEGLVDLRRGRGAVITEAASALAQLYREAQRLAERAADLGVSRAALTALVAEAVTMTPESHASEAERPRSDER